MAMDDLHDETSDLHDEAAHVADELASADGSGQLAPLSDARLETLNQHFVDAAATLYNALDDNLIDSGGVDEFNAINRCWEALLAEVKRRGEREAALLAERERLLAVVRAVVSLPPNGSLIEPIYIITREMYKQARAALADAETGRE